VSADTNGVAEYEVEAVLAQRSGRGGGRADRELLVRWKGYGAEHDQWQPRRELTRTAPEAVAEFDSRQQGHDVSQRGAQVALQQLLDRPHPKRDGAAAKAG